MNSRLITQLSFRGILTTFNGAQEGFRISTKKTRLWSTNFITVVEYDLASFDAECTKDYVVLSIESQSLSEALGNHIALSKLVLKEEPINWSQQLIEEHRPKYLIGSVAIKHSKIFSNFKSDYSKAILAINNMNPSHK
jgi:hypothetical protein